MRINVKKKIIIYVIVFLFVTKLLDSFIFSFLFLKFPNELEWDTSPWYNFLHYKEKISFVDSKQKILVAGSSVATYSFLPDNSHQAVDAKFFSHVAMSPTDLNYYAEEMISKKPDMIFYIVNPGDFQMDHFVEGKDANFHYSEYDRVRAYANRYPVKYFYPFTFLKKNYSELNKKEIFFLLTKSLLNINRYRTFIYDPIESYIEHHYKSNRSYHNYLGPNAFGIDIYRKGWTGNKFAIACDKSKDYKFEESLLTSKPDTEISVSDYDGEIIHKEIFSKPGWHKIKFKIPPDFEPMIFYFTVNKTVSSKEIDGKQYGKEYFYGVRLSQKFCTSNYGEDIFYSRLPSRDDYQLESMSSLDYEKDYFDRMYKDANSFLGKEEKIPMRPEVQRLNHLHKVKKFLANNNPDNWSEFNELETAIQKFKAAGIPFTIVNSPENPLELNLYKNGIWYSKYLSTMKKFESDSVRFLDYKDIIAEPQFFIDSHHLTFKGAKRFSDLFYSEILKANSRTK